MSQNHFTLQLSAAALDRLFQDSGPEFVLKIKQAAIEEFARRRIKALQDTATETLIEQEITKHIGQVVGWGSLRQVKLAPEFNEAVKDAVKTALLTAREELFRTLRDSVNAEFVDLKEQLDVRIKSSVTAETRRYIDQEVKTRLKAAMEAAGV